jgi:hypothetical protein
MRTLNAPYFGEKCCSTQQKLTQEVRSIKNLGFCRRPRTSISFLLHQMVGQFGISSSYIFGVFGEVVKSYFEIVPISALWVG